MLNENVGNMEDGQRESWNQNQTPERYGTKHSRTKPARFPSKLSAFTFYQEISFTSEPQTGQVVVGMQLPAADCTWLASDTESVNGRVEPRLLGVSSGLVQWR